MEIHESFVFVFFFWKGGEIEFEAFLYLFEQTKSKSKPTLFSVHVETKIVSHTVRVYLGGV
jgi:hypothetical protein|tara:strand:- start:8767 stop:8949 length:183 start_codon:yes stop_codon:yes gene_type:complete